jgi:hypothetical protein
MNGSKIRLNRLGQEMVGRMLTHSTNLDMYQLWLGSVVKFLVS